MLMTANVISEVAFAVNSRQQRSHSSSKIGCALCRGRLFASGLEFDDE